MEYLELGDLLDYMEDRPRLPESEAQEIAFQILEGLEMMHRNEFAHRDLKPKVSPSSQCVMSLEKPEMLTQFSRRTSSSNLNPQNDGGSK